MSNSNTSGESNGGAASPDAGGDGAGGVADAGYAIYEKPDGTLVGREHHGKWRIKGKSVFDRAIAGGTPVDLAREAAREFLVSNGDEATMTEIVDFVVTLSA